MINIMQININKQGPVQIKRKDDVYVMIDVLAGPFATEQYYGAHRENNSQINTAMWALQS